MKRKKMMTNHGDEETNIEFKTDISTHEIEALFFITNGILNCFHLNGNDLFRDEFNH